MKRDRKKDGEKAEIVRRNAPEVPAEEPERNPYLDSGMKLMFPAPQPPVPEKRTR